MPRHVFSPAAGPSELDDLEVAERLARTCYELYRRVPAGLAPEIAFFLPPRVPWPKAHPADVGGGDFVVKAQVTAHAVRVLTPNSARVRNSADWNQQIHKLPPPCGPG